MIWIFEAPARGLGPRHQNEARHKDLTCDPQTVVSIVSILFCQLSSGRGQRLLERTEDSIRISLSTGCALEFALPAIAALHAASESLDQLQLP
jgi:hypothetical protein